MRFQIPCLVALVALTTSGCAFTSYKTQLKPEIQVSSTSLGHGAQVYVEGHDERSDDVIGNRTPVGGGEITPEQDVGEVVENAMVDGLRQMGFQPVQNPAARIPQLRIEARALDYKIAQGFWAGGLDVDVALKAICILGDRRPYEKLHRGHHEESIQVVQSASQNEYYINSALSQAINQVLSDRDLLQCLASRPAQAETEQGAGS